MTNVFHRHGKKALPVAVGGDGVYVIDNTGTRYLDGSSGGFAASCLGHSHPAVIEAIRGQVGTLPYIHGGLFTTEPLEDLADILMADAPSGLEKAFFVSSGSEAVETAIMLARQYSVEVGQPGRRRIVARRSSYHGATLTGLAVGHNLARRAPFEDMLSDVTHISPCNAYRGMSHDETDEAFGRRVADELEEAIQRLGPETVLAFVAETVGGSTSGATPPAPGYFKRVREICDRYGVFLILDEVFCGLGRTGTLHACTQEGVAPDFLTLAKGLGAGYQPIGAVLVSGRVHDAIANGSGSFKGGFTYSGHATACAGALAVQKAIRSEGLLENVVQQGRLLHETLTEHFGNHPYIGDIRGRGLMQTIELVADRATKEPFSPSLSLHDRIRAETMARGLLCAPAGGTADGRRGDHVSLTPPYIIREAETLEIVKRLDAALASVFSALDAPT